MATLAAVIRNTSREHCKSLFESLSVIYPPHWENDATPTKTVLQEARKMAPGDLEKIRAASERITHLSKDDLGQDILLAVVNNKTKLQSLDNPYDRAAWTFHHEPQAFKTAEHYYFLDANRNTRMWDGFLLEQPGPLNESKLQDTFLSELKVWFGNTDDLLIEVYPRSGNDPTIPGHSVHQVMIYREGLPNIVNEMHQQSLLTKIIKPVRESALVWDPDNGELEVISR